MASKVDIVPRGLARPYTHGSFQGLLDRFQDLIKEITLQGVDGTQEERRLMITENLRYDHFCESIREIFGGDIKNNDLKSIYRKISTNPDAKVDWSELFGYFQGDGDDVELALGDDISVFMVSARRRVGDAAGDRKRRDSIQSIKYIPHLDAYITASQKGAISVWSTKLNLQSCTDINLNLQSCTDINETAWVTGCDYVPGIRRVVVCTERSIAIWDSRAKGKNQQVYTVKPIESSPQCVACVPLLNANSHEDTLLFGDDEGYLNLMTLCAKDFTMKNQKGDKRFSQSYIIEPNKLTVPIKRRRLHDDWVLKIKYFPELRCFASCSPSSTSSFVLEEVERVLDDGPVRGVAIPKGVNAFDYCVRSNIIATGGVDKVIRVWHPHIFSRPTGKLVGHLFTIVDIVMNEKDQHIISLSTARVVRIWDINTLTSLQVFTDSEDRPGEKRIYSMMFDNKFDRLFTGSCVLDVWPLTRSVQDTMQVPHTHDRPISQLVYNAELKQLVSVCTESIMRVWEMSTGKQVYQIVEPNGQGIEVTALALDMSGFRMVTGALDGSLKVWDFGSGQELKYKPAIAGGDDRAVLGLRYCQIGDERVLIVAGWRNSLWMYQDSNDSSEFVPIHEFYDTRYLEREHITSSACSSLSKHSPLPAIGASPSVTSIFRKEYVLSTHEVTCMRSLLPDTLVTGCSNGDIILWDISKERSTVRNVLELEDDGTHSTDGTDSEARSNRSSKQECPRAVNSIYFLTHRVRKLDPAYMKRLAHLHSSEDGDSKVEDDTKSQLSTTNTVSGTQEESSTAVESHAPEDGSKHQEEDNTDLENNDKDNGDSLDVLDEKQEEKQHSSDSPSANNPSKDSPEEDDNPENHMIVESFPPVMVTCHQDAYIRFWDLQGNLLREVSAKTRHQGAAVTALCHDQDCNIIVTADRRGYLTMWEIGEFLENPHSEERVGIKQVLCWRAHLTKITKIVYVDAHKVIVSGSTDGSLRLWWGKKSRFIGFFGQHRVFNYPTTEDSMGQIILPYDITEGPVAPVKSVSATQKMLTSQNKFDYPLIFDNNKWMPFRRSAYIIHRSIPDPEPQDKKFFGALIKPKPYLNKLESYTSGEMRHGAVFRALPVYRVPTPERLKTPDMGQNRLAEDTPVMFKAFAVQKGAKAFTKNLTDKGNKSTGKKSSRTLPSSTSPGAIVSPRRK